MQDDGDNGYYEDERINRYLSPASATPSESTSAKAIPRQDRRQKVYENECSVCGVAYGTHGLKYILKELWAKRGGGGLTMAKSSDCYHQTVIVYCCLCTASCSQLYLYINVIPLRPASLSSGVVVHHPSSHVLVWSGWNVPANRCW